MKMLKRSIYTSLNQSSINFWVFHPSKEGQGKEGEIKKKLNKATCEERPKDKTAINKQLLAFV